ncbi:cytochrome c [Burkholderiaceae bacterium DAT-1]|nr:cytochrome c [Burkholderiaceae bacterium DAT-1]
MNRCLLQGLIASLLLFSALFAAADADLDKLKTFDATAASRASALKSGEKVASFCANCHGSDGNSRIGEVPNLAGQHPAYLLTQIRKFANGQRKNEFMEGLVKALSEDEKLKIVYYFSNAVPMPAGGKGNIARGQEVFRQNCAMCHGPEARGAETFPRLAGQQSDYLRISLERYRTRSGERIFAPMSAVVGSLKPEDVDAVVAYLSNLR